MRKLPITVFIASCNEAHQLTKCINALYFCQEIVVIDLESTDNTKALSKALGAKVISQKKVPYVELIKPQFKEISETEWFMSIDPDEEIRPGCSKFLIENFDQFDQNNRIGAVNFPWVFFFKEHQLKGTHWGSINSKTVLMRKSAVEICKKVHSGIRLKQGYEFYSIIYENDRFIAHYWMTSYRMLFEKHIRYFRGTGEVQYHQGHRTNYLKIFCAPFIGGFESYFLKKGYKDGFVGVFLALFYSWLNTGFHLTLLKYQNSNKKNSFND